MGGAEHASAWPAAGDLINELDEDGDRIVGATLLVLNGKPDPVDFLIPNVGMAPTRWELLLDTARPDAESAATVGGEPCPLQGRSLALLRLLEEA